VKGFAVQRLGIDVASAGAVFGLLVAIVQFVVLVALSFWLEGNSESSGWSSVACLLRMVALLGLAFGTGLGYLISG
jgi:hypothetical protein